MKLSNYNRKRIRWRSIQKRIIKMIKYLTISLKLICLHRLIILRRDESKIIRKKIIWNIKRLVGSSVV